MPALTGENPKECAAELRRVIVRRAPIKSARVSAVYATDDQGTRWWRVCVMIRAGSSVSIVLTPRFAAFDHATVYRLAAIDALSDVLGAS